MSVRLRLTLWYTSILSATLLLLGLGFYFFLHYSYYDSLKVDLSDQSKVIATKIKAQPSGMDWDGNLVFDLLLSGKDVVITSNMYIQIINLEDLRVKFRSTNIDQLGIKFPQLTQQKIQDAEDKSLFEKVKIKSAASKTMDFMIYYQPVYTPDPSSGSLKLVGMIQIGMQLDQTERLFLLLRWVLAGMAVLVIALAASVGWFISRKAFNPIEQVIAATDQIEKGADLARRIEYKGPNDEIGRLTQTINGMLGRLQHTYDELEEAYRAQRRFVSDASHELRTPLTTIRGNVDLLEKMWRQTAEQVGPAGKDRMQLELSLEAMHDIAGEAERMSRLVNDLLSLARADAGFQMAKTEIELRPLVDEVVRKAQLLPRSAEWIVGDLSALDGLQIYGNSDYVQQLIFIFIENAFKYTDRGYVRLDALRHDGQVGIRIEDTGIGMDKEEIPHIFERFYRADPSRGKKSGTGLGLSIAKWIIDEHNGSIEVKTIKDAGSTFVIWLPVLQPHMSSPEAIEIQAEGHSLPQGNQV